MQIPQSISSGGDSTADRVGILVVDDRPDNTVVLRSILETLNQRIVVAHSGEEALKRILEEDFAVILLDVHMPHLDGLETAALIRARKKSASTPIIFITAYADETHVTRGYSLGAVDYIFSPIVAEILQAKVKVFVELSLMTRQVRLQTEQRVALAREQAARAAAEESSRRASFLAQASRVLASSIEFDATVQTAARIAVPRLADICALTLIDDSGRPYETELAWLPDESSADFGGLRVELVSGSKLSQAISEVIGDGKPQITNDLYLEYKLLTGVTGSAERQPAPPRELHSCAHFPLMVGARSLGVLSLGTTKASSDLGDSDISIAEDLAERIAVAVDKALLYREIREADRRKMEFLAMLGHELRNPLTPIYNAVEVLSLTKLEPEKALWAKRVIRRQVQQLMRLVDELLDVSRITQGKIQLKLEPTDVSEIVDMAVETNRPLINSRGQHLSIALPDSPLKINVDSARVGQALSNLLNNAAKFSGEGGHVGIFVTQDGEEVVMRVKDDGIGLTTPQQSTIFELFSQGEDSDASSSGLGIGLNLVKRLVELHGGTVCVFSPGKGQGSEFTVRLPLHFGQQTSAVGAGAQTATNEAAGNLRILVVDDNSDVADSMAELLNQYGYDARAEYSGAAALNAIPAFQPNVILLDIGMPDMDGFEAARRIKSESADPAPILIAVSGYGQESYLRRAKESGFDHCVIKPLDLSKIESLLQSLDPVKRR